MQIRKSDFEQTIDQARETLAKSYPHYGVDIEDDSHVFAVVSAATKLADCVALVVLGQGYDDSTVVVIKCPVLPPDPNCGGTFAIRQEGISQHAIPCVDLAQLQRARAEYATVMAGARLSIIDKRATPRWALDFEKTPSRKLADGESMGGAGRVTAPLFAQPGGSGVELRLRSYELVEHPPRARFS